MASSSPQLRVLSPVAEDAIQTLKNLSSTLRGVSAVAPQVGRSEQMSRNAILDGAHLNLHCDETCLENLRVIGEELSSLASALEASLEEHFVAFFAHVKSKHEKELALWVRSSTAVSVDQLPSATMRLSQGISSPLAVASSSALTTFNANKNASLVPSSSQQKQQQHQQQFIPSSPRTQNLNRNTCSFASSTQLPEVTQQDLSFFSIQSWLLVELESLVATLGATKGAVYIRGIDAPDFLRLAAMVPRHANEAGNGSDPVVVPAASHSILTTVVSSGVGASITRNADVPTPRSEISFEKCVCMPLFAGRATDAASAVGCVVVTDKKNGREFEPADELRLWAFCSSASGVFQRYSVDWFVPPLLAASLLPPVARSSAMLQQQRDSANNNSSISEQNTSKRPRCNIQQLQNKIWAGLDSAASVPGLNNNSKVASESEAKTRKITKARRGEHYGSFGSASVDSQRDAPARYNKIAVIRTGTVADAARAKLRITDVQALTAGSSAFTSHRTLPTTSHEQCHEEVIESVAPYLRNLEGLWRKALDECARMKNECMQWRSQVDVKDAKIIELEVALRHLTRQVTAMQTDVELLRNAVPESLALASLAKP